jgi:NAD-dependent deacetylase
MGELKGSPETIERIAELLTSRRPCVALTGAGISVPSGIPDFRSRGGLWDKFNPEEYATSMAWKADPEKVWELFRAVGEMLLSSRPNPAHSALGELERLGVVEAVITQNIDGLHQAGGSGNVIEFHGNGRIIFCTRCGRQFSEEEEKAALKSPRMPRCIDCGGLVRPDVVLFGEAIPAAAMTRAFEATERCRSMLVIGTSGMVAPASSFPYEARRGGAAVIEVNITSTPVTRLADISFFESVETALPRILACVREKLG